MFKFKRWRIRKAKRISTSQMVATGSKSGKGLLGPNVPKRSGPGMKLERETPPAV